MASVIIKDLDLNFWIFDDHSVHLPPCPARIYLFVFPTAKLKPIVARVILTPDGSLRARFVFHSILTFLSPCWRSEINLPGERIKIRSPRRLFIPDRAGRERKRELDGTSSAGSSSQRGINNCTGYVLRGVGRAGLTPTRASASRHRRCRRCRRRRRGCEKR